MGGQKDDANLYLTARAAIESPLGMDGDTENFPTKSTEPTAGATPPKTASGHASTVTGAATLGHSLRLSDEERAELLRLRTVRKRGWMLSMSECDWLLGILERVGQ